ncbi:DNA-binding protein SMUBP-2 [Diabrotica virgifera virgifera]|uniref:DNA-binding protein SMUBP-2 n=1 Tax=Diabrotica virgifera virgifera TaxID=50390 RepID=A0A6P7G9B8_DIAVI|nr:DNA-binding protein SMUBP-2 [Diabrotica virgifera virgifera]
MQNKADLSKAVHSKNIDEVLEKVTEIDYRCSFDKCKNRTHNFAIDCKFCKGRFCTSHGLPEIHGCGEAVKKDERKKMLHPEVKLSKEKHSQAQTKLNMKLKQMQLERKPKGPKKK